MINFTKKLLLTGMMCSLLFVGGISQAAAPAPIPALSYSMLTFDAGTNGPITKQTVEVKYVIKIVNHSAVGYKNIALTPTGFCFKSLTKDFGCITLLNNKSSASVDITPFGTTVIALDKTEKIADFNVSIRNAKRSGGSSPAMADKPFFQTMIGCIDFNVNIDGNDIGNVNICDVIFTPDTAKTLIAATLDRSGFLSGELR